MKKQPKARKLRVKQLDGSGGERETNDDQAQQPPESNVEGRGKGFSPESMERLRKAGKVW